MAIQYVGGTITPRTGSTSGNTTITLSSGLTGGSRAAVAENDLVIAMYNTTAQADRTLDITDGSSGYSVLGSEQYVDNPGGLARDLNLRIGWKFMGSTPDGATTFGPSGGLQENAVTAVAVYSGVDLTTPFDVAEQIVTNTTSLLADPSSITPVTANALILAIVGGAGPFAIFPPNYATSDMTMRLVANSTSVNPFSNVAYLGIAEKAWTGGAFDPAAWTNASSTTNCSSAAFTFALRPAVGGAIKVWNGTSWVVKPVKVWNGSSWEEKPLKFYNGTSWVETNY